jgi:hypothetical protein
MAGHGPSSGLVALTAGLTHLAMSEFGSHLGATLERHRSRYSSSNSSSTRTDDREAERTRAECLLPEAL